MGAAAVASAATPAVAGAAASTASTTPVQRLQCWWEKQHWG